MVGLTKLSVSVTILATGSTTYASDRVVSFFQIEIRQDYGNAEVGTCLESLIGGNHFRCVGVVNLGLGY